MISSHLLQLRIAQRSLKIDTTTASDFVFETIGWNHVRNIETNYGHTFHWPKFGQRQFRGINGLVIEIDKDSIEYTPFQVSTRCKWHFALRHVA